MPRANIQFENLTYGGSVTLPRNDALSWTSGMGASQAEAFTAIVDQLERNGRYLPLRLKRRFLREANTVPAGKVFATLHYRW